MFNFAEATARACESGAAVAVGDAEELVKVVGELLVNTSRRRAMRAAALAFHATHRGAADRLWAWLEPRLAAALARRDESR
jgi:3-deoxy-D-manno-octulosonic-acid transferase